MTSFDQEIDELGDEIGLDADLIAEDDEEREDEDSDDEGEEDDDEDDDDLAYFLGEDDD